jgi:tetratricopeptide (TPR) repeat protein
MPAAAPEAMRPYDSRERALTWGIAILVMAAPMMIGGAHPSTQVGLAAAAMALLVAYLVVRGSRGLRLVPFAGPAALALGFTVLQLVPLPAGLVAWLSPQAHSLRLDVAPQARWMPLSVDTPATWLACARGLGCLALLLLTGGLVRTRRRMVRLLTVVAMTSAGLALVAAAQRLAGSDAILGVYHPRNAPGFGVFGTFVDVNHAASVLALGALVAAGLAAGATGARRGLFFGCAAVSTAALLFTTSRGALVGFAVGGFVMTGVVVARSLGLARALVTASVLSLVGASVALWSSEGLRYRFRPGADQVHNQKTRGWIDGLHMAADYRWTGVGRGAFESPVNAYRGSDEGVRLVYPENVLVEMASEWGVPLSLLLLAMMLAAALRLAPRVASASPPLVGAACGVVAVVVHELTDFGLELPGVAFPTIVTLGVVVGRLSVSDDTREGVRAARVPVRLSIALAAVAPMLLVGAAWAARHTLDVEFSGLRAAAAHHPVDDARLHDATARHPADDFLELLAAEQSYKNGRGDALHHINRALRVHPTNWQAHRMAAFTLASMNRGSQAAIEYRLAIETGMPLDPPELGRMLRQHVVDAVPQTPPKLVELARGLYSIGLSAEADAAAQRAIELADPRLPFLMARVQMAIDATVPHIAGAAARALLQEADTADAFALAAQGLARASAPDESRAAIEAGAKRFPSDGALLLTGADLRFAFNDFAGARALLARAGKVQLSLRERLRAELLLAEVADRSGDVEAAATARARSRLIEKQLQDMTLSGKAN